MSKVIGMVFLITFVSLDGTFSVAWNGAVRSMYLDGLRKETYINAKVCSLCNANKVTMAPRINDFNVA